MHRGFTGILILVGIVTLVLIGVVYFETKNAHVDNNFYPKPSPSPSETKSNWKIGSPEYITEGFYLQYLECINHHFAYSTGKSPKEDCPYTGYTQLTTELQEKLASKNIHADPVLCAQDTPTRIQVDAADIINSTATITVHTFFSQDNPIHVALKNVGSKWLITDITCSL